VGGNPKPNGGEAVILSVIPLFSIIRVFRGAQNNDNQKRRTSQVQPSTQAAPNTSRVGEQGVSQGRIPSKSIGQL
jgi:hypothetical protein